LLQRLTAYPVEVITTGDGEENPNVVSKFVHGLSPNGKEILQGVTAEAPNVKMFTKAVTFSRIMCLPFDAT
jgi:hypothetical protein